MKSEPAIVLFDGVCNLCEGVVRFLAPRDRQGYFRFAPLQSATGRALLERHGLSRDALETFVLVEETRCLTRSDAALALVARLPPPWSWLRWLRVVPRGLRDRLYGLVVRHRYRWFGRKERCMVPGPELRARFLEDAGVPPSSGLTGR